jgi:hydrogenase assembly chaperone HypC/HupF
MSNEQEKAAWLCEIPGSSFGSCEVIGAEGHCVLCSDEALPARVLRIDEQRGAALVTIKDEVGEIDITLVDEVMPGDWLLVHGGVAIATVGDEVARNRVPTNEASDE